MVQVASLFNQQTFPAAKAEFRELSNAPLPPQHTRHGGACAGDPGAEAVLHPDAPTQNLL